MKLDKFDCSAGIINILYDDVNRGGIMWISFIVPLFSAMYFFDNYNRKK